MTVSAEVRFDRKKWMLFEVDCTSDDGIYHLRITSRHGVRTKMVAGETIGDVLGRAIDFTAEAIAPVTFDYVRTQGPEI